MLLLPGPSLPYSRSPMSILITILLGLWMLVALLMMLVILMQRPKSEGLGAAFGGAMTENLFGAQTTNVLVKFTAWLAGIFFVITFGLSVLYAHRSMGGSTLSRELKKTSGAPLTAPAGSPTAAAAKSSPAGSPATSAPPADPAVGVVPVGKVPPANAAGSPAGGAGGSAQPAPAASQPPKP
jgi:preprotein translocase subunit SecG